MAEETEQVALTTTDGTVFDVCEGAAVEKGRDALYDAVARRIATSEKRSAEPVHFHSEEPGRL